MEDDRGVEREGREAVAELVEQWRYAGSLIPQIADLPRNGHLALVGTPDFPLAAEPRKLHSIL